MKINYDKIADAVYLKIRNGKIDKSKKVNDNIILDLNKKGDVVGIEMLEYSSSKESLENLEKDIKNGVPINIVSATPVNA